MAGIATTTTPARKLWMNVKHVMQAIVMVVFHFFGGSRLTPLMHVSWSNVVNGSTVSRMAGLVEAGRASETV